MYCMYCMYVCMYCMHCMYCMCVCMMYVCMHVCRLEKQKELEQQMQQRLANSSNSGSTYIHTYIHTCSYIHIMCGFDQHFEVVFFEFLKFCRFHRVKLLKIGALALISNWSHLLLGEKVTTTTLFSNQKKKEPSWCEKTHKNLVFPKVHQNVWMLVDDFVSFVQVLNMV